MEKINEITDAEIEMWIAKESHVLARWKIEYERIVAGFKAHQWTIEHTKNCNENEINIALDTFSLIKLNVAWYQQRIDLFDYLFDLRKKYQSKPFIPAPVLTLPKAELNYFSRLDAEGLAIEYIQLQRIVEGIEELELYKKLTIPLMYGFENNDKDNFKQMLELFSARLKMVAELIAP